MNSDRPKLILASSSPRRRELLSDAGFEFEVIPPDESVEKGLCSACSPAQMVDELARAKAAHVATQVESGLIIAADTIAECQGQILGKPVDVDHAESMLRLMSGKKHRVLTGLCLLRRPDNQAWSEVVVTTLEMDVLDDDLLEAYLDSDQWIGKAGAFGFQDGLDWVRILEGSMTNVVGLPMEKLKQMLEEV